MQRLEALRRVGAEVELIAEECVSDRRGFLRLWQRLNRRLDEKRFDVVVPLYGSLLGLLCAAQRRVPCALSLVGSDLNGSRHASGRLELRSLPSVLASQLAAALSAGVSVCGPQMKERLWWPSARAAASLIPDGIDTRRFRPRRRDQARRARGLPVEGVRVAFVALGGSDLRGIKRVELAREAVARLPGAVLDELSDIPFDQMPFAYAAADALVLTSLAEGSPNCVREALACAVPVVSVDVGDVSEMLRGLTNCAVVADDPEAIAHALAAAIGDGRGCPEGPERMARERSIETAAARFIHFYEGVAGGVCT
jgi:glycosyltransferase involved in cell wall biosynthesis